MTEAQETELYEEYVEASAYHDEVTTHHLAELINHPTVTHDAWREFEV